MTEAVRPEEASPPDSAPEDRAEILLKDILAGPDELALVLDRHARAVADLPGSVFEHQRWRLLGMGSSRFAALDAATHFRAAGIDAAAELASASLLSEPRGDTVAVLVSNSGKTPEVVEAAESAPGRVVCDRCDRRPGVAARDPRRRGDPARRRAGGGGRDLDALLPLDRRLS